MPDWYAKARMVEGLVLLVFGIVVALLVAVPAAMFVHEQLSEVTRMLEQLRPRS